MDFDKMLSVRVPITLAEELQAVSRRDANQLSSVVRRLLREALERERRGERLAGESGERGGR